MVIGLLIPCLVLGAIGYVVFRLVDRDRRGANDQEVDVRQQVARLFRLGLLFAALVLATEGIAGVIGQAVTRQDDLVRDPSTLARALSFSIVGLPVAWGLLWWTGRKLADDPGEAAEVSWALYLGSMLTVSLLVATDQSFRVLEWALGLASFDGPALGRALAWSALLGLHWVLNRRRPLLDAYRVPEERMPWYLLVGSFIGLVLGSIGLWQLVRASLRALYDAGMTELLVSDQDETIGRAAISTVLGVGVWVWFWWGHGRRGQRTDRWFGYVLLVGVLGGLLVTLSAAGALLHAVLQWFFGDPGASSAATHFAETPEAAAAGLVATAVWVHHRRLLGVTRTHRNEADRAYTYLVSFIGLSIGAAAVALVVSAFIESLIGGDVARRAVSNAIVLAVTFLLVGLPVWLTFWRRAQHNAAGDLAELRSPSRRVYLLAMLGISAAVALVSLVVLLTEALEDVTAGELSDRTIMAIRVPLGLLVAAAAVAGYHVLVHRGDRAAGPPPPPPTHRVRQIVLITDLSPEAMVDVRRLLGHRTGEARVVVFTTTTVGPTPHPDDVQRALAEVEALTAGRALVIIRDGSIEVQGLRD